MAASTRFGVREEDGDKGEVAMRDLPTATRTTVRHEVVWTIERFEAVSPGVGRKVSKTFRFAGHEWMLSCYPDGCSGDYRGFCGVFLRLISPNVDMRVSYRMSIGGASSSSGASSAVAAAAARGGGGPPSTSTGSTDEVTTTPDGKGAARPVTASPAMGTRRRMVGGVGEEGLGAGGAAGGGAGGLGGRFFSSTSYARSAESRRFNSCDKGAKVSWGFPTFIRRQDIARRGLLSSSPRGALVIRVQVDTSMMAVKIVTGEIEAMGTMAGRGGGGDMRDGTGGAAQREVSRMGTTMMTPLERAAMMASGAAVMRPVTAPARKSRG